MIKKDCRRYSVAPEDILFDTLPGEKRNLCLRRASAFKSSKSVSLEYGLQRKPILSAQAAE